MRHEAVFLGYYRQRYVVYARLASWRKQNAEEHLECRFAHSYCLKSVPGQVAIITTRSGALGWEWIEDFAVPR
jgi:hypothetical protein